MMIDATGSLWSMLGVDPYRKWRRHLPGTQSPGPAIGHSGEEKGGWQLSLDELERHGADISGYEGGDVWDVPFHDPKDRFDFYANKDMAAGRGGIAPRREDFVVGNPAQAPTTTASGSKPATGFLANIFNDDAFTEAMRDQLAEAGADYDAADQPFKSLADTNVGTAFTRHKPVAAPSMLTTRGIPTGGSYNPYLGDPAKRKRPR